MRFASLGSGSKGNATLVAQGSTCIMVDCGFSVREVEKRMTALGMTPQSIDALLITHEHGDHIRGAGALARKYNIPVYLTHGTLHQSAQQQNGIGDIPQFHEFDSHTAFTLQDISVTPFPVPHDAREPCQFVFHDGAKKLGLLTDTGSITRHICEHLSECDALILECNHDVDLLWSGDYPPSLKQRVAGDLGHLSNAQAAALLDSISTQKLKHLVAAHLSEKHNSPLQVRQVLSAALDCETSWIEVIDQETGLDWRQC